MEYPQTGRTPMNFLSLHYFSDTLSVTHLIKYDIDVGDAKPVRQRFYYTSPGKQDFLESEVKYKLDHNIALPSRSSSASPCLLVIKPGQTLVGSANSVSNVDLLKGYWQIPLS